MQKNKGIPMALAIIALAGIATVILYKKRQTEKAVTYAFDDDFDDEEQTIECTVRYEDEGRASA
jgi:hypothetical protein